MQWLRNLPVSRKFIFAFGIVCGLSILLGAFTCITFQTIATKGLDVSNNSMPSLIALADLRGAANTIRRQDLDLLLCSTPACLANHQSERQKYIARYQATKNV